MALVLMVLGLCTGLGTIRAASIPIPNSSFESPAPPPGFPATPLLDAWQDAPQPVWYDPAAFGGIAWDQTTGAFPNPAPGEPGHITNTDGAQAAYMFALPEVALSQELEARYEVGLSYTLTVGMVSSSSQVVSPGSTFEISLYYLDGANAPVTVASTPVTYTTAGFPSFTEFVDFSVNLDAVEAGDPWAGQNIGIRFVSTFGEGGIWDLDHVRLEAIPEPGSLVLTALGLAVGLGCRRQGRGRPSTTGT